MDLTNCKWPVCKLIQVNVNHIPAIVVLCYYIQLAKSVEVLTKLIVCIVNVSVHFAGASLSCLGTTSMKLSS